MSDTFYWACSDSEALNHKDSKALSEKETDLPLSLCGSALLSHGKLKRVTHCVRGCFAHIFTLRTC